MKRINWIAIIIYTMSASVMLYFIIKLVEIAHKYNWNY